MQRNTQKDSKSRLAVVIVHYGDLAETYRTLHSLDSQDYKQWTAYIVDNDPKNRVDRRKLRSLKYKYFLVTLTKNLGWAGGANAGAKLAVKKGADIVTFMTSDLVVQKGDFLTQLAGPISRGNAKVTLPVTTYLDDPSLIWMASSTINLWTIYTYDPLMNKKIEPSLKYINPDYGGKGLTFDANLLAKIKYWDTSYFLYYEDVDICLKAKKLGCKVHLVPEAVVMHNVSTYKVGRGKVKMQSLSAFYAAKSSFIFAKKHLKGCMLITGLISQFIIRLPLFIASMLIQNNIQAISAYTRGLVAGVKYILNIDNEQYT